MYRFFLKNKYPFWKLLGNEKVKDMYAVVSPTTSQAGRLAV